MNPFEIILTVLSDRNQETEQAKGRERSRTRADQLANEARRKLCGRKAVTHKTSCNNAHSTCEAENSDLSLDSKTDILKFMEKISTLSGIPFKSDTGCQEAYRKCATELVQLIQKGQWDVHKAQFQSAYSEILKFHKIACGIRDEVTRRSGWRDVGNQQAQANLLVARINTMECLMDELNLMSRYPDLFKEYLVQMVKGRCLWQ